MIPIPKEAFLGLEALRIEVQNAKNRYEYSIGMNGAEHERTKQYLEEYDRLCSSYGWLLKKVTS